VPVWLDAGDADPFRPGQEALIAALGEADVTERIWPGGHDGDYWDRHWADYLRFYARELERC
jgi:endo-alpha-1,4-polygalactosaminidase (GH114 family)